MLRIYSRLCIRLLLDLESFLDFSKGFWYKELIECLLISKLIIITVSFSASTSACPPHLW